MFYADDSQLYITIDTHDQRPALNTLQKCISEVIEWNIINKLVCNRSKTEVIQFRSRFVKNPINSDFLIGNTRVQPSDRVPNLGVNLDRELNLIVIILMKHAKRQYASDSIHWQIEEVSEQGSP